MSDEQVVQSSSNEQTTSQEAPATQETLDQVYSKYNVESGASEFQPQRQQQPQQFAPQQPAQPAAVIPDPVLDRDGFQRWQANQTQQITQEISRTNAQIAAYGRAESQRREEADIQSAVTQFKSVVGDVMDADMAEVALGQRARKDPKFAAVYNNRSQNPQAWKAAVNALGHEWKGKTQFKTDPQLAENVRAAKQSIQGSPNKPADGPKGDEARFDGKNGRDFTAEWSRYTSGGNY